MKLQRSCTAFRMVERTKIISADRNGSRRRWHILPILTVTQAGASLAALSFGPLAPFLQESFQITRAQVGLFSSSLYIGSILVSIPAGRLADRWGVRLLLLVGPGTMALLFFALSQTTSYRTACVLALFAGMGYGFINPATTKAIVYWFSAKGRATAIGIKQSGVTLGAAIAAAVLPASALALTLPRSVAIAGAAVLVPAVLCFLLYRDFPQNPVPQKAKDRADGGLMQVLTNRNIILLSLADCVWSSIQMSVSTYFVLYLKESLLFPVVLAGGYLAAAQMSAGIGRVFWGVVSDYLFQGRRKIVFAIIGAIATATTSGMIFLTKETPGWAVFAAAALIGVSVLGRHGVLIAFISESAGKASAGTAIGVSITISYIGIILGPPLFGYIVDSTRSYAAAWLGFGIASAFATALLFAIREKQHEAE